MKEYHKIESVFIRNTDGSKKLIEGCFNNPAVEYLKNNIWQFTEKIDGTNIRVCWDGHRVTFGGRTERASIPAHLMNKLNDLFSGDETEQIFEQLFGEKEVVLYGEGYGDRIQAVGKLYTKDVNFILFDVLVGETYLQRDDVESVAKALGIDVVPVILEGTIQDGVDYVKTKPNSRIGTAPMEGLVGKPRYEVRDRNRSRIVVKIKCKDFENND